MLAVSKLSKQSVADDSANLRANSLANKAYEQIRDEILRGTLGIGDILSRRRLADKLNMSFLPITEALQRLESEGLVESRPRIGTRVRIPTKQDVLDSYVVREALETQAARLCCERITNREREQLIRSAKHLDSLDKAKASENGHSRFSSSVHIYHMQFHTRIAELTRSPGLVKAIEKAQVLVFDWLYDTATWLKFPSSFHYDLAKAICSRDVAKADQAMRNHIRFGQESVVEGIETLQMSKGWRLRRKS
jgi:DNA-binding GntR family transcriptional regulator